MRYGVSIFPTDISIRPDELAAEVERLGFDSLWFPEHSHIPVSRETPWGGMKDAPALPEQYWRTLDLFVALGVAATATTHIKLGAGIALLAQRDPIWTAKEAATVDHLSNGRLIFGIGYGWNKEEMAQHGTEYQERRALLREKLGIVTSLWTQDEASYQGDLISLDPSWAWPKPVQKPHPPVVLGASAGPRTIADLVAFCDGWIPNARRTDIGEQIREVRAAVEAAGRDPDAFEVTAYAARPELVESLIGAGVDRIVFTLPPLGGDVVLPKLLGLAQEIGLS